MNIGKNRKFGNPDNLLLQEFIEAWAHYRHLETSRNNYLGFFFTVIIATSGFVLTIFKDFQSQKGPWLYFGMLMLIWIVNVLSFFMFTTIKKAGFVLKHYEDVMQRVRYFSYKNAEDVDALMNVREKQHPVMKMTLFSTQRTAELIPAGTVLILTVAHGMALYSMWGGALMLRWQALVSFSLFCGLLICALYIVGKLMLFNFKKAHNEASSINKNTQPVTPADTKSRAAELAVRPKKTRPKRCRSWISTCDLASRHAMRQLRHWPYSAS